MKDHEHPFFRPLWRRIAIVAVCAIWAALEWAANSQFWGMIASGFTAYAIWQFLYLYKPIEPEKPADSETRE